MAEYPISVAHAALKFIADQGLHDAFFASGALTGRYCDEHCGHPPLPVSDRSVTANRPERTVA